MGGPLRVVQRRTPRSSSVGPPRPKLVMMGAEPTILVVEDDDGNRLLAEQQLSELDYSAIGVGSGGEAVEAFRRAVPSAILMDCRMPEMDGFQAARAIRSMERAAGGHVPIIAMTAGATRDDRRACLESGMDDVVTKPVMLYELRAVLDRWVSGRPRAAADSKAGRELRDDMEPEVLVSLIDAFLSRLPAREAAVRRAIERDDAPALRDSAHALRSAAALFHAARLTEICGRLEALGRSGTTAGAARELQALSDESRRVSDMLTELRRD